MLSIQRFLLIILLSAITLITILGASWTYYRATQKIANMLDAELMQSAQLVQHIVDNTTFALQKNLGAENDINLPALEIITPAIATSFNLQPQRVFQIWTDDGVLLLKSKNAPDFPLANATSGFSESKIENHLWRVYTLHDSKTKLRYQIAHRHDLSHLLARHIASTHIIPYLIIYPLFAFIIVLSIYYGLRPLRHIAQEIFQRKLSHLAPIDISQTPIEIHPLLKEMNSLFARLEEAYAREKRFTADAAHELKTPLAALKTHAQLAENAHTQKDFASAIEKIIMGVDRCTRVIQQLLTLSGLRPEQPLAQVKLYDLPKLAIDVIAELIPLAREKNIEVALEHSRENIFAPVNAVAFQILLRNLVDNAIRYTGKDGHVTVKFDAQDSQVILSVIDTGPGVPEELHDQIFERFYRQLGTNTTGSGLGLSIVKQIAQLHGATIAVKTPAQHSGLQIDVIFNVV